MSYRCTKYRTQPYGKDPNETVKVWETRKQMLTWLYRHKFNKNTIELYIQDNDGDLIYYLRSTPHLEEMYRKDGTLTKLTTEIGL